MMHREPWGVRIGVTSPRVRLLWFYHAGGSADAIVTLHKHLPQDWELLAAEYPGRGFCASAPTLPTIEQRAQHFANHLRLSRSDAPLLVFGHSMGALVAFEFLRRLQLQGHCTAAALLVSAFLPPSLFAHGRRSLSFSDEQNIRNILVLGGIPEEIFDDEVFQEVLLPRFHHDFVALDSYMYAPGPVLDVPIFAFAGKSDPLAPPDALHSWCAETQNAMDLQVLDGGHFYYQERPGDFVDALWKAADSAGLT